ncbi:isoniazid response ATPase/transcriptional regulator IniR [Conyzicola nivalis]|uniref:LuxR family transcriptional regulator n=1 Tax=Conyzicola nivalis TaxID=1477021 RepID=A0A916SED5_9MICO|nr:LuxR C-terminal-related transcriptional regulator [Conyzicola nivalis]GGA94996.1 LuxR family transcriptional regulator [Conyzicola nivalis]
MSPLTALPLPATRPPFVWERHIRTALDAVAAPTTLARAYVVGNAGSGKSSTLRHLYQLLQARERDAHLIGDDSTGLAGIPPSHVVLVDDLHLLHPEQIAAVLKRAERADAGLIVASRPWPTSATIAAIAHRLEQTRPAVVLGHLSPSDVRDYLADSNKQLSQPCLDHILEATGGVSWLVAEALHAHDDRDCAGDTAHTELRRHLQEHITHRLESVNLPLRDAIEKLSIAPPGPASALADRDTIMHGYAEGLLLRNGQPVPLVRWAVHATMPIPNLVHHANDLIEGIADSVARGETAYRDWLGPVQDKAIGHVLATHAHRLLDKDPAQAAKLLQSAVESGLDPAPLAGMRAQAAWATGDLDSASRIVDETAPQEPSVENDRLIDTAAAIWSTRGMMEQADKFYRVRKPVSAESQTRAAIAALGVGDGSQLSDSVTDESLPPSTLQVAMQLLRRGLATSVASDQPAGALADLVRATDLYTRTRTTAAIPELPAVVAAIVALNLGGLATAATIIKEAIRGQHGGQWGHRRLLLWRAWIAVQQARPAEARAALDQAQERTSEKSARDALLASAIEVAIARRYDDAAGLEKAWQRTRGTILRTDVDLYVLHPLAELVCSATRLGDIEWIRPHFHHALDLCTRLQEPPLWSAHLRWAGVQQGILAGRPELLAPHAKALVTASAHSRVASVMAKAGRVWTSVLAGSVDADAIEAAATDLASIGLIWDAARLAGHGAGRTDDRKIAARLLSCARALHPTETGQRVTPAPDESTSAHTAAEEVLSEREIEIAQLVLQGKTYAAIGEAIYISPRTVEHHIAHIRRRLGATSRSDVLAKLRILIEDHATST